MPLSWQYPLVEFLTGAIFVGVAYRQYSLWSLYSGFSHGLLYSVLFFAFYSFVFSLLMVIALYDIRHKIIPDSMVFLFIGLSVAKLALFIYCTGLFTHTNIWNILGVFLLPLPFALMWYFSDGKWIGLGDAKLMAGIGALLGLSGGLSAITIAFWIGAVVGVSMMVYSKMKAVQEGVHLMSEVPFAPFLILATFIIFLTHFDIFSLSYILQ